MDQPAFAIGDIERLRAWIVSKSAKRRAGIALAVNRHRREQADQPGDAIDLPDRSRPAARPPLPRHERRILATALHALRLAIRPRRDDRQPVSRTRRDIDIGRRAIIERHAEHLADQRRADREWFGRADHLALRWPAHARQIDDAQRRPVAIDEADRSRVLAGRDLEWPHRAGEASDRGIAGRIDAARRLRDRCAAEPQRRDQQHGERRSQTGDGVIQ